MNARRYPRTMNEAFGPYCSRDLQPMRDPHPIPAHEKALYIVSVIALVVVVVTSFIY